MANQDPGMDIGWLVSNFDARNSTNSGTTRGGLNGSGQFLAVQLSTTADLTIGLCTVAGMPAFGILQNKPSTGIAADVRVIGASKAVAGSTTIVWGGELQVSSTQPGALIPFSSAAGTYAVGRALEDTTNVGQIFSAWMYGVGRLG